MSRTRIIDGNRCAEELKVQVAADVAALRRGGASPGLATVLVGGDYPAHGLVVARRSA